MDSNSESVAPNRHPSLHANLGFRLTKWDRLAQFGLWRNQPLPVRAQGSLTTFVAGNGMKFTLVKR